MAFPQILQNLFQNAGAGPLLREDIIPLTIVPEKAAALLSGIKDVDGATIVLDENGELSVVFPPVFTPGDIQFKPFRATDLAAHCPGWYFANGDRYSLSTPQGQALNALPDNYKTDWAIVADATSINLPKLFHSDGRGVFLRAVDGTLRQVGSFVSDTIRNHTHTSASAGAYSPAGSNVGWIYFSAATLTTNSTAQGATSGTPETMPLNAGMTPAIFIGV